ncbi:MAG: hypothetical protein ABTS22_20030 [Accumulibacter sp.]|uniref:hypothetical protein n=1 Tax=Accumulibacter sp. TaxID=2053492 RepID=UPI003315FB77
MEAKIAALQDAIKSTAANSTSPGLWSVESGDDYVMLVWTCGADAAPEMYGDEPWSEWGGNEIIAASGLPEFDCSGGGGYRDQYGTDVVGQWVLWND